jgi:ABC-type uncharacterized transport system involved in gliding motility auxiliary subunit
VLVYIAGQWRELVGGFSTRQARYGALASLSVLVVLGILVAVNYIGARQNKRWDLTANKAFSLSDQSRSVLTGLDAPLQIRVFAQEPDFPRYRDRLAEYEYTSSQVSTEYVDPDKRPTVARENQVQQYGTIVFSYKGRSERVVSPPTQNVSEQDLTNGIIKVVTGQQKKVYFVQGHGEHDTASSERDGYNAIAGALGSENYTVDKLVRRCVGCHRRGAEDRLFPPRGRSAQDIPWQGGQAPPGPGPSRKGGHLDAEPDRAGPRVGHGRRQ